MHQYIRLFRETGVPVDRALARSTLPGSVEETPDAYLSLPLALPWMAQTGSDMTAMELGFQASRHVTLGSLDRKVQTSVATSVSGLAAIRRAFRLAALEDTAVRADVWQDGENLRLCTTMPRLARHPHACLVEWMNVMAMTAIVRDFLGPAWAPEEITFVSQAKPPVSALEAFDGTRILCGQPQTSIIVQAGALAPARGSPRGGPADLGALPADGPEDLWTFQSALRAAIRPYLGEGQFSLAHAAEIAGTSQRTLQRRLTLCGTSFAETVQQARFECAREWLRDASLRVSDVALMAGYENPQHFSRAFRKYSGLTPSDYRQIVRPG
ncbi:AraC family transcriptional regulator [Acuticoccus kandeliae]|uniref:AraC family transcriptional regulator n=1 Tax=Acuticoccus kandeliae TaxID=2073160 RepID=UPI0014753DCA|nr:AraC family transcriptional regulator [Acuticoccus kandeliae]